MSSEERIKELLTEAENYRTEARRLREENDQLRLKLKSACLSHDLLVERLRDLQNKMKETRRSLSTVIPTSQIEEST